MAFGYPNSYRMPTFHILDAISQDVELGQETETTRELIPRNTGNLSDDDDEIQTRRKKKVEEDEVDPAKLRMNIYLFGKTATGEPLRACIEGFEPFFWVKLPDSRVKTQEDFRARLKGAIGYKKWLHNVVGVEFTQRKVLFGYTADKLFPFAKLSVPSLKAFRDLRRIFLEPDTSKPKFEIYAGAGALDVFEANLDPMLRFFHLRNIKPCGWVRTDAELEDGVLMTAWDNIDPATGPIATAPFLNAFWDIECYSENGEFPLPKKGYDRLAKQLYAKANSAEEAVELILAAAKDPDHPPTDMDGLRHRDGKLRLEALEKALDLNFTKEIVPVFEKKEGLSISSRDDRILKLRGILSGTLRSSLPLAGDPIIQIGVVLVRGAAVWEKHIFVLGTCDEVPGAVLHTYKTEKAMLLGWATAMAEWNPDVLTGYNVFGFDEQYLWKRAEELKITADSSIQSLSRLVEFDKPVVLEEKFLSSSAMGDNTLYMWTAFGRLQVDLFHYIKRSFSLPAYKLDYVCQHFMSGKCGGIDASGPEWIVKTKNTDDVVIGRYVVLLDETGDAVVDKLKIVGINAKEAIILEAPTEDLEDLRAASKDVVKWAIVKDDVSPQDIFALHRDGGSAGRARVAAYCVQDCDLTVELYKKLDVFNNAMAMANACSVPVGYIFTRGQGIKIESLIFKECYERGQCIEVLPTQPRGAEPEQQDSYEGAIVLTPEPGFYFKSPVGVADFASLYPSTIISENISHDSLVWVKNYDLAGKFIGYDYGAETTTPSGIQWTDIEFDVWGVKEGDTRKAPEKVVRGKRICRYAQLPGSAKSTLPQIVQGLLAARKAKRKEAEKETDPFKKALLDAEQLAYKLTANSLYGQLGSGTFKIRLQHLAASVTAYGRKQIMFAKAVIERFYGPAAGRSDCEARIVYGDTDSLFVDFRVQRDGKLLEGREAIVETQKLTTEAGQLVSTCLKPPHDFEYDKVFSPFIIFSKKRYVGNKYEESPDDFYQNSMGIATKRRDYAGIVKVIYGGAIRILLSDRNPEAAANFVKEKLMDLADGKVSTTQLTLTKSLRAEYKSAVPPAHKMLAERIKARDPGNAPASGDRISFMYIMPPAGQQASKLQGDRIETPIWIKERRLEIDYKYYMEHQLMNPLSQLFSLIVEELPGCEAPGGRAWSLATASDRETAATEYLFGDALRACDKTSQKRLMNKMFGAAAAAQPKGEPSVASRTRSKAAEIAPKVQMNIKSLFAQQMILNSMEPPKKAPSPPVKKAKKKVEQ
jgi:DNA polymerase elongation subunit (family B)